ncbi:MAG: ABC transporter permease [Chloroflexota bacterium]
MNLLDALRVALVMVWTNRLRSALTMLGMIIGVSSVIILVAVGQGAVKGIEDQIRGLGTNLVFITPGAAQGGGGAAGAAGSSQTVTAADADALAGSKVPGIVAVVPQLTMGGQVITSAGNVRSQVIGTTPTYAEVRTLALSSGSFFNDQDVSRAALKAVIGASIASTLFPAGDAVGQTMRVTLQGNVTFNFTVVGVLNAKGSGFLSGDNNAYVPITALQARVGSISRNAKGQVYLNQIDVQTAPDVKQATVKEAITEVLLSRHAVATPDFQVQTQDDLLGTVSTVSAVLSVLLGSIAGISLVVGGIGVMNIMLVSVTERTREIGIRLAIGASAGDIIQQFITEALALTITGGLVGVLIGTSIAWAVNGTQLGSVTMSTSIQPWSIVLAFVVSAVIGVLSGLYPAWRASRLDPITALRAD